MVKKNAYTNKELKEFKQIIIEKIQRAKEENMKLAMRQEKFINNLKNALIRIQNKSYGVCRVTGKLISKDRLKLVPHATLSIEAKKMQ